MKLNEEQLDALAEVINIGVGRAAASLSQIVDERIELAVPSIQMCTLSELDSIADQAGAPLDTLVVQGFRGEVNGRSILGFSHSSGLKLAQILSGTDSDDNLDLDLCGILDEVGNILLNAVLGSLANMMKTNLSYTVPVLHTRALITDVLGKQLQAPNDGKTQILMADAHFNVAEKEIRGSLVLAFELNGIEVLLSRILSPESVA